MATQVESMDSSDLFSKLMAINSSFVSCILGASNGGVPGFLQGRKFINPATSDRATEKIRHLVVLHSGGMDSSSVLHAAVQYAVTAASHASSEFTDSFRIHAIRCFYGSKHNEAEVRAASRQIEMLQAGLTVLFPHKDRVALTSTNLHGMRDVMEEITYISGSVKSSLLQSGGDIPFGHYEEESMKQTVVPGRNLILSSIAASYAESLVRNSPHGSSAAVLLGVHSGDHAIYPDCRPAFVHHLNKTVKHSSDGRVGVSAPFISSDKSMILLFDVWRSNLQEKQHPDSGFPTPYNDTWTCYVGGEEPCGKCGACTERLEAFSSMESMKKFEEILRPDGA